MMNPTANWSLIPEHLRSSVEGYLEYREHPGDYAKDGELRIAVGRKLLNLVATIESILPGHWRANRQSMVQLHRTYPTAP